MELLLGSEDADRLQEWYREAAASERSSFPFSDQSPEERIYVVFIVRRSAALAVILEQVTGLRMQNRTDKRFLTDGGLLLQTANLAAFYRNYGRFPEIRILDELMIRGGNLRHFLEVLEKELAFQMKDVAPDKIHSGLVRAVRIRIFAGTKQKKYFLGDYAFSVKVQHEYPVSRWRELSVALSSLLYQCDSANAGYICSAFIDKTDAEHVLSIRGDEESPVFRKTVYQNVKEYTSVRIVGQDRVRAVLSLRLVEVTGIGFRALPFVFLPNLTERETERLWEFLFERLKERTDTGPSIKIWADRLRKIPGLRSANEFLTLLLSLPLLQDLLKRTNLSWAKKDFERELQKMVRNYNLTQEKETERILRAVMGKSLLSLQELEKLLETVVEDDEAKILLEVQDEEEVPEADLEAEYRKDLENKFYDMNLREERESRRILENYEKGNGPDPEDAKRYAESNGEILEEILSDKGKKRSSSRKVQACIRILLQMMDAGVLGISSYPPQKIRPQGLSQFAKAGEMSQQIRILEDYEFLPLLRELQTVSKEKGRSMEDLFTAFCRSPEYGLEEEVAKRLLKLLEEMRETGQEPMDWNTSYLRNYDFGPQDGNIHIYEFLQKQLDHVDQFRRYIRKKTGPE